MKVREYKLLVGSPEDLEKQVNELLKVTGWQPWGSPAVLPPTRELAEQVDMVFQAMVRMAG